MKKRLLLVLLISIGLLTIISCGKKEEKKEEIYAITYDGVKLVPGEKVEMSKFTEEYEKAEEPNCALGGKGYTYTFEELEIATKEDGTLYSIYVFGPNVKTDEGIYIGDEVNKVKDVYGKAEVESGLITYKKGEVELSFVIDRDKVLGIEYKLIVKE